MVESKRLQRIEQHDIQVAGQTAVLETVVQQQNVRIEPVDGQSSGRDTVAVLDVRHFGKCLGELKGFVVLLAGGRPVAAADKCDDGAKIQQSAGEPFHHRRFARATEREVAHADDGHADAMNGGAAAIVTAIPHCDRERVGRFYHAQQAAERCGSGATASAADEVAKFGGTEHRVAVGQAVPDAKWSSRFQNVRHSLTYWSVHRKLSGFHGVGCHC